MVLATPDSLAMICCVRRAMRAASSVGSARASSYPLVCRDCVPPSTADSAWMAVRTMLFSGCCAVSVEPAVWVWKRSIHERGFFAPKWSRMMRAQSAARAAELGDLFKEFVVGVEKERQAWSEAVDVEAGIEGGLHIGHAVGEGEGDLLRGGRAGLAHVVAGDGDRVPFGHVVIGPREHVGDDAHGVADGIDVSSARDVLLEDVVLHGAGELLEVGSGAAWRRRCRAQAKCWRSR